MGRFFQFPTLQQITDTVLFVTSIFIVRWFQGNIQKDLYSDPNLTTAEYHMRIMANFEENLSFKFSYLFSANVICLIFRISVVLQFSEKIGPLVKIVSKMSNDFFNFLILYAILAVMFALVANLNFIYTVPAFEGLFESSLTVIDASLGNFDFKIFETVHDGGMALFGEFLVCMIVISFNMLLLNLMIAILANTYNMFDLRSNGLYLSKILNTRGELLYDDSYGAFLAGIPPINVV